VLRHRHFISFFTTILIYIGIAILFLSMQYLYVGTEKKHEEKIIKISLSIEEAFEKPEELKELEPLITETIEPEPPKETVEPKVEKIEPEPIIEKVIPKPIPVVKKKKIVKKKIKKKKYIKKKRRVKKKIKKRTTHKSKRVWKKASKAQANPAKKNAFLAKVRSKISQAKSYPRIAQRRGMQGSVKVRFTILANGHVSNIQVSGKKVFLKSAREAVKKAFPLSVKNCPLSLPSTVNFTLRYQLR